MMLSAGLHAGDFLDLGRHQRVHLGVHMDVLHGQTGPLGDHIEAGIPALAKGAEAAAHPCRSRQHGGAGG